MVRSIVTPIQTPEGYDNDLTRVSTAFTVGDPVNGHRFRTTGKEFIYVRTGASVVTNLTVLAGLDTYGRAGSNFVCSLPNQNYVNVTQVFPVAGWVQPDGYIYIDVDSALISFVVIQISDFPDGPQW